MFDIRSYTSAVRSYGYLGDTEMAAPEVLIISCKVTDCIVRMRGEERRC